MIIADFACRICNAERLRELPEFSRLLRVTSDCKPFASGGRLAVCLECGAVQKPADARWQQEAAAIYQAYEVYYQSGGVEQTVFDTRTGTPRRRSAFLLEKLAAAVGLPKEADVLDVGCGNGAMLAACATMQPAWRLFGHDLSTSNSGSLARISGFQRLYHGPLEDIPGRFDLITMIHSLEHFTDPLQGLAQLRSKIRDDGVLFIQVPNNEATPFDLLIADHISHFTRHDLARLLDRAGLGAASLPDDWVTKEISAVAQARPRPSPLPPATPTDAILHRVRGQIAWLEAVQREAQRAAERRPLGLFGTSIAAMWLFGQLRDAVSFFVDEDPSRHGTTLFGRPVLQPSAVPDGAAVLLALLPRVAEAVAARLARPGVDWRLPPALPSA